MHPRQCATCPASFVPTAKVGKYFTYCAACRTVVRKAEWQCNRAVISRWNSDAHRKAKYGITGADYQRLLDAQGGACKLCGDAKNSGRRLTVDHDHATGLIRGLLCLRCNTALGMFKDDVALLGLAIRYLDGQPLTTNGETK